MPKPDHLSGYEYLRGLIEGEFSSPAMLATVPMRITDVGEGVVDMTARADARHGNTLGGVHGGFAATVIDSVTGCAIHSLMQAGESYVTISLELKMLRPLPFDETLFARGRVINLSSGIRDTPHLAPYSVSKAAVDKYTLDLAAELKGTGVIASTLDPGWIKTDMGGNQADNEVETVLPGALVPVLIDDRTEGEEAP